MRTMRRRSDPFAYRSRRGRAVFWLLGATCVAGGAAFFWNDDPDRRTPAVSIAAAPASTPPPSEVAKFASLAETAPMPPTAIPITTGSGPITSPSQVPSVAAAAVAAAVNVPDTPSNGLDAIDFDKIRRDGDHYVAPLAGGRGREAVLTLDPDLQTLAEKLLNESRAPRGAIVAMAPDGRILALAGRRTEDPAGSRTGTFDWRLATEVWAPAASIFKLVTASALVKAGVDPKDRVCYHGGVRSVMESNLRDHARDHRCEDLGYGVAHSQNAIMGKLAYQKLEPALLEAEAKAFGWSDPVKHLGGTVGELEMPPRRDLAFAKTAAGFTGTRLSVVGGAVVAATFAAAGERPVPRIVASVDGVDVTPPSPTRTMSSGHAKAIAQMMVGTCETGSAAKTFRRGQSNKSKKVTVAGKTGTLTKHKPFYMEHSWFVGFAPASRPEIVVSVLLGNPEDWHLRGHEAARRLIDRALQPAIARGQDRTRSDIVEKRVEKRNQW